MAMERARIVRGEDVHWVVITGRGALGAERIETCCGMQPFVVWLADEEPVSCVECLALDGRDAVAWAEAFVLARGKPVAA